MESVFYSFGGTPDGSEANSGVILGTDGNFYGVTNRGGVGNGTVFKITPAGVESVLWSFAGPPSDGLEPQGLIQASDGNFYGTTYGGGANNDGTVFKITPAGVETVLWSFGSGTDGSSPAGGLIEGSDGNFYGITGNGGGVSGGAGTVFKITPAGVETVVYSFGSFPDGSACQGNLVQGTDGNFYGTCQNGGQNQEGIVFKVTPAGAYTRLYTFGADATDAVNPHSGLILGSDGNFYGTSYAGGSSKAGNGTVYKLTPAGVETVLWSFGGTGDGIGPEGALIQGSSGDFYGTTSEGGANNEGILFELTPAGVETVLHSFGGSGDGQYPSTTTLIQTSDGSLYGTTSGGGATATGPATGSGTVFKYGP